MGMPGRKYSIVNTNYRYGFNGKENDNEVKGEGNQQDYGMRIYDPRLMRFLSVDPLTDDYPELTPYQFASNRPIASIDIDGLEAGKMKDLSGQTLLRINNNTKNNNKSFETINLYIRNLGEKQRVRTKEIKYFSNFAKWSNALATGDSKVLEQNPITSVSKKVTTTNLTVTDMGEFGKYLNIVRTEEETVVDISGGGLRGLKSITTTTTSSNMWLKIKSEDPLNNTFEVYSNTNGTGASNNKPIVSQIPLGNSEQESLQKLPTDLRKMVKEDSDKNEKIGIDALKKINSNIKKLEDKANAGKLVPGNKNKRHHEFKVVLQNGIGSFLTVFL